MGQEALMQVLHQLPEVTDKNLLVGSSTVDDAAVYRVTDELALVTSVDFFPPIVDDPYSFGAISAANALSDIYAMGGAPKLATAVVCFPKELDLSILAEIMKGATDKITEAGAVLAGGHSVEDREIKFGFSVTGYVHPDRVTANSNARPGQRLILTKPVGTGVITSALKAGRLDESGAAEAIASMKRLNADAAAGALEAGVRAMTDVTGYGLIGHAMEMAEASGVNLVIDSSAVSFFPHAIELVGRKSNRPRNLTSSREFLGPRVSLSDLVGGEVELLLYDPQTSGGLLIAVPDAGTAGLWEALTALGADASIIGRVVEKEEGWRIRVE